MKNNLQTVDTDTFTHISTALAVAEGVLDTNIKLEDIKQWGNFGFGGTAGLEEGIIILDNEMYFPKTLDSTKTVSIALLTFFNPKHQAVINHPMDVKQFGEYVKSVVPTKNIMYAVKLEGSFDFVRLAILPSFKKPFPRFTSEDIDRAKKIEVKNITGTLLAFWLPDYVKKVNAGAGKLHVHFLSRDKKVSGHVEDCHIINGNIEIDYKHSLNVVLPKNNDFYNADFNKVDNKMIKRFSTWTQEDD